MEADYLRENAATSRSSARDMLARSQSLRNLNNITEKDFAKALETLPEHQANAVKAFHASRFTKQPLDRERDRDFER